MRDWKDICQVKTFFIDGIEIPSVSLGTSPFIGAGQFGPRAGEYYKQFYLNPMNIVAIIKKSTELGIPAVQALAYDKIIKAIVHAQIELGLKLSTTVTIGVQNWKKELEEVKIIDPAIVFIHARITDLRNFGILKNMIQMIEAKGMIPGCATHNPVRTIPFIEDSGLDIKCYLAPANTTGLLLGEEPERLVELLKNINRTVIAKKVLAAGSVGPEEAFSFVSKLKNVEGITVGIASVEEACETFDIAKRFWPKDG